MKDMMGIEELMDLTMYSSMYLIFAMAAFYVEGANLMVPSRVNLNFKRIVSRFLSFFRGFIGAGGWSFEIRKKLNDRIFCVVQEDGFLLRRRKEILSSRGMV